MRTVLLVIAVLALLCVGGVAQANVYLNNVDYGSTLVDGPQYLGYAGRSSFAKAVIDARAGDVIEFRDNNSYEIRGQNAMSYAGVTVRSAAGYRATISATDGGTNGTFELGAAGIRFQNLNINGTAYNPGGGTYAFQFSNSHNNLYDATGFTVQDVTLSNLRSVIDAGNGLVQGMAFVNNIVTNTNESMGAGRDWGGNGMNFGGGVVITGNTFTNNGIGTSDWQGLPNNNAQAALWIGTNVGSLLIDGNTFRDYNGRYAVYGDKDLSLNPITFGTNDFGMGVGGSGAAYQMYALDGGGYAVGLLSAPFVPEPSSIIVLLGGLGSLLAIRRRRA